MPIEFRCDQCQRLLRVPDQSAGAQARCPQCSHVQQVPSASSPASGNPFAGSSSPESGHAGGNSYSGAGTPQPTPSNPFADAPPRNPFSDNPYETPSAAGYQPQHFTREMARSKIMAPAIIMMILGILSALMMLFIVLAGIASVGQNGPREEDVAVMLVYGTGIFLQMIVIIGSIRMLSLKNYALAITATIISLVCGLCGLISIPFAIWALVVLCDSNVKSQFS